MRTITKIQLLVLALLVAMLASVGLSIHGMQQESFYLERSNLSHNAHEAYLELQGATYQLFKQYGDSAIVGGRDPSETNLVSTIRQSIDKLKYGIGQQVALVGDEERVEFETLSAIETSVDALISTLQRAETGDALIENWQTLSQILESTTERNFYALIDEAIREEEMEVLEIEKWDAQYNQMHQWIEIFLGIIATIIALACLLLTRTLANNSDNGSVSRNEGINRNTTT